MTEKMEHFDQDPDLRVSSRFSTDLDSFFRPQLPVPPEVDRAVLDSSARHFTGLKPAKRPRFRLVGLWKVAAAAAVIILAFSLNLTEKPAPTTHRPGLAKAQAVDIDRNGRVDILDAFKLARQIELAGSTEANLDINGDGLVNRDDVDIVALAAVRLDKGV
jgi:hypothetical protein